ncbi:drug resistance transporter, EmrB/QacA subfamily [Alicyclobacillus hesperidum URH17-3-68]|uniref:DHA2 family efflux MFS transporter permease subunit n=1 Tax=Alicyclobacillus hesperidum TaxID=89784 RepID=UPI000281B637|nr:DHA2 family efflux MFS transporter permease subunit [Alicyclobacillus hesperidum]EJY55441.1 drug resistance transporter, EmrB/QacA subfamily [Alicyclobacillus hesperidum URH17-3-68]
MSVDNDVPKPVAAPKDPGPGGPTGEPIAHKAPILISLILGAFAAILNQTLLNVAVPKLMTEFNVSASTIQWLSTGYMLTNGIVIPLTAFLIGTFTTRQLFLGAMFCFGIGTLFCAAAPDFPVMLIGRIVQAAGAGIMMPLMMTVILNLYPPETRGKAMGTIGIAMFFAPAVGPTLSGWIIQQYSWRVLFYIVIPVAVIDIIVASIFLKNVTERTFPKFEGVSFVASTIGLGALLYGFSEAGNKGWHAGEVLGSIAVGVVFLIVFVARELTSDHPLLNLRVFRYPGFSIAAGVSCVVNMAMFGGALLTPMYVQNIRGYSALDSGLILLPGAILMGVMSPISGALLDKIGIRPLAIIGLIITVITTWDLGHLTSDTPLRHIMWVYTIRMFGMGFIMMTIMTSGLNHLPRQFNSHGTAAANTVRTIAGSLGTSLLITVMTDRSNMHYNQFVNSVLSTNPQLSTTLSELTAMLARMMSQPLSVAHELVTYLMYGQAQMLASVQGVDDAYLVAAGISLFALILSLFLRNAKRPIAAPQRSDEGGGESHSSLPDGRARKAVVVRRTLAPRPQ